MASLRGQRWKKGAASSARCGRYARQGAEELEGLASKALDDVGEGLRVISRRETWLTRRPLLAVHAQGTPALQLSANASDRHSQVPSSTSNSGLSVAPPLDPSSPQPATASSPPPTSLSTPEEILAGRTFPPLSRRPRSRSTSSGMRRQRGTLCKALEGMESRCTVRMGQFLAQRGSEKKLMRCEQVLDRSVYAEELEQEDRQVRWERREPHAIRTRGRQGCHSGDWRRQDRDSLQPSF